MDLISYVLAKRNGGSSGSTGGGGVGSSASIIDVYELPDKNINSNTFYRLAKAEFIIDRECVAGNVTCEYVEALPEIGKVCTNEAMGYIHAYYSVSDNEAYGYVDSDFGLTLGIPANWYPVSSLFEIAEIPYHGIITDINDDPCDGDLRLLLGHDFYIYQDEWMKIPFAYEKAPKFDIRWDGVIGDRFSIDMSSHGYTDTYLVKVSDIVLTADELIGCALISDYGYDYIIEDSAIDDAAMPGTLSVCDGAVVIIYSADDVNAALGAPSGYVINGTYFAYEVDGFYANRLVAPARITKIDERFLSNVCSKSDVKVMIAEAIGAAIGGAY